MLFSQFSEDLTYLVDGEGQVVHTWQNEKAAGSHYLQDDGHLIRLARMAEPPNFKAGGVSGYLQELSWDGELLWEWHVWGHLVQNHDPDGAHYGVPAEHPRRLDVNPDAEEAVVDEEKPEQLKALGYVPNDATTEDIQSDFLHMNAIDYHPGLDQIVLSVPEISEVWILDHSTSSEEEAHREAAPDTVVTFFIVGVIRESTAAAIHPTRSSSTRMRRYGSRKAGPTPAI